MPCSPFVFSSYTLLATILVPLSPVLGQTTPQMVHADESLRGKFVQDRTLAGFAKPLRSNGAFTLYFGRGLIWQTQTPFENVTVIEPQGILVRTNGRETLRLSADRLPGLSHLYDVLGDAVGGNLAALQTDFALQHNAPSSGWQILLTPLHPDTPAMAQIKSLTVSGHKFVETIEIDKGGGDVDRLSFLDQTVTTQAPTADEASLLGALKK